MRCINGTQGRLFKVLMYGNKQHRLSGGDEQLLPFIGAISVHYCQNNACPPAYCIFHGSIVPNFTRTRVRTHAHTHTHTHTQTINTMFFRSVDWQHTLQMILQCHYCHEVQTGRAWLLTYVWPPFGPIHFISIRRWNILTAKASYTYVHTGKAYAYICQQCYPC